MTKHHWRQQIKSFFESNEDPDKLEQLKQSRKDMEEKKEKMIKLIKEEHQDGNNGKNESLIELLTNYDRQYESLYDFYHNLADELKKKVHRKKGDKEKTSSSSSDSDSDTDKEYETKGNKNGKLQKEFEEEIGQLKAELEAKLETVSKLENENAELRSKVVDLELNLRSAERKADELRGNQSNNDQIVIELQTTIEDLKRDIEMDKDEITTIEEKNRNLEVLLRLSNQKLRVTEQLLNEKEGSHKKLEERNVIFSQTIKQLNSLVAEFEGVITKKLNESYGRLDKSIFTLSKEVKSVKSWVAVSKSENDVRNLAMEFDKVKAEKEDIARALVEMEKIVKEKDERILNIGEEKREAIKQLCVWAGYYRSRRAELHGVLLNKDP